MTGAGDDVSRRWRSLAKDGARRAEIRRICSEPLIDYSGASWGEWFALAAVAEACVALRG